MSEPLRIAAAVEGPTDVIVLEAILKALLSDTDFELQTLQPEASAAFGSASFGTMGAGWTGVYRWSRQAAREGGGSVSGSSALSYHDVLIVHVDADVASKTYASGNIRDAPYEDLPCDQPCPPVDKTTNALRAVVLNWLGEHEYPPWIVLCTPSKSIEAWVLAAIWPDDERVRQDDWECLSNPLKTLPKHRPFKKRQDNYRRKQSEIEAAWQNVSARLTEAARFEAELLAAIRTVTAGRIRGEARDPQP